MKAPEWICFTCGRNHISHKTPARVVTCHEGVCGWCGKTKSVCSPRNYNWPKSHIRTEL